MNAFLARFASRKFTAFLAGIVTLIFSSDLGITPEQQSNIVLLLVSYIGGQSVVDTAERVRAGRL